VWFAAPGAKLYLFCATLLYGVFSIFFEHFYFFWYSNGLKENPLTFFLSKSKVQESKNVYINYFYRNLKFFKDWITESQIIHKIVKRKFTIFSSGLFFKEKLFKLSSSFLISLFLNIKYTLFIWIETLRTIDKLFFRKNYTRTENCEFSYYNFANFPRFWNLIFLKF